MTRSEARDPYDNLPLRRIAKAEFSRIVVDA